MPCCGGLTCGEVAGQGGHQYCVDFVGRPALRGSVAISLAGNSSASPADGQQAESPLPVQVLAQCVAEGQDCGGPGLADRLCCGGMTCKRHNMGTHNLQCVKVKEHTCKARGEICGCAGCRTMPCCGGLTCGEVAGQGGQQYCVDFVGQASLSANDTTIMAAGSSSVFSAAGQQTKNPSPVLEVMAQCVAEGQDCGGPGLEDKLCCGGLTCKRHNMGTSTLQCVREHTCVPEGRDCGGPGLEDKLCCGGMTCKRHKMGTHSRQCVR